MALTRRASRGFTLIELLVAVAIIAVLIGVLLPALAGARVEGQKGQCLAHLREICRTAVMYAQDDPKTILGPVHPNASDFQSGTGYAEYGGGPGTMPYQGWDDPFDPRSRPFNKLFYGDVVASTAPGDRGVFQVFMCPGEEYGWQEWQGFASNPLETENPYFKANGVSFRMNNLAWTDGLTAGIYGRSENHIPQPAITLAFFEVRVFQTLFTNDAHPVAGVPPGELTGFHRKLGFFNAAYADGHASFVDFGNGTYYDHMEWPNNPEFRRRDNRGTWGRMDCLPDALLNPHVPN